MLLRALLLFSFCINAYHSIAQTPDLNVLIESRARKGLPNFFEKIRSRRQITIGYLGGSITEASGGWREQSLQKLKQKFPGVSFTGINAGVSGTGSDLGAFRVQKDVIDHHPDLVFVEFAVNDAGAKPERIHDAMEGIVRKIWRANRHTDICFVYTVMEQMVDTLKTGRLWPSMLAMEQIAEYYGIPMVMFAKPVMDRYNAGELIFAGTTERVQGKMVFSRDKVHPYATTGHKIYTEALMRFIESVDDNTGNVAHHLKHPYTKDNWEDAMMLPVSVLTQSGTWKDLSKTDDSVAVRFLNRLPHLIASTEPGASLSIRFKGRLIGLYDVIGPGCGQFKAIVDNQDLALIPRFDKYATYWRTNYFFLSEFAEGAHHVTFSVAKEKLDKQAILKQATVFQRGANGVGELGRYSENACYAGWVLLLGKPVQPTGNTEN